MLTELGSRNSESLYNSLVSVDALGEGCDAFVGKMMCCMEGVAYVNPKAPKKAAKGKAAAGGEEGAPKKSMWKKAMGLMKKKNSIAPLMVDGAEAATAAATSSVPGVSDEESSRLKKLFELIDRNGNGTIDLDEFKAGVMLMGFLETDPEMGDVPPQSPASKAAANGARRSPTLHPQSPGSGS